MAVCLQHADRVLLGRHRIRARGGLEKIEKKVFIDVDAYAAKVGVPHEIAEMLIRAQGNVHRRISREERRAELLALAKGLEPSIEKHKIAARLTELLPFAGSYVLRNLPSEYKQTDHVRSPGGSRKKHVAAKSAVDSSHQKIHEQQKATGSTEEIDPLAGYTVTVQCDVCRKFVARELTELVCDDCSSKIPKRESLENTSPFLRALRSENDGDERQKGRLP